MRTTPRMAGLCGLALLIPVVPGCPGAPSVPRRLALEGIRPADGRGVYLNEELVLTFSLEVDPTSITAESLAIVSADGHRARGEWSVHGRQVRFQPLPVLARDCSDGGYLPDTGYTLRVAGFPRLDGLRADDGTPLSRSWRYEFTTVGVGADQPGFTFDDASPGHGHRVQLEFDALRRLGPDEPLLLKCAEPLDPSTLVEGPQGDFWLVDAELPDALPIFLSGRFTDNHPEGSQGPFGACAVIELMPLERLRPGGEYFFGAVERPSLADFRGNLVWPVTFGLTPILIRVGEVDPEHDGRLLLSFLDRRHFSAVEVPWADGLAHWDDSGRLEIRYPAAAGSGVHGALQLEGALSRTDLHGTEVSVPAGAVATLAEGPGLRVLRSQGRLTISAGGRLVRRIGGELAPNWPQEPQDLFREGETLSQWLERAAAGNWDWTVLVAGGDLVVEGPIEVDTPLLLVAGGWIRASASVRQRAGELWLLRDGGGMDLDPTKSIPNLIMDPPRTNPLRRPLRFAAVSAPLPAQVQDYRWLQAAADGRAGAGAWSVRFLPPDGPLALEDAVDHPRLLAGAKQLRLLLALTVEPGEIWDPPSIDYVELRWKPED